MKASLIMALILSLEATESDNGDCDAGSTMVLIGFIVIIGVVVSKLL